MHTIRLSLVTAAAVGLGACAGDVTPKAEAATLAPATNAITVIDSTITASTNYPGTALALREATLSTKLMASVRQVLVTEGARVGAGALLVQLDASDLEAKRQQADAGLSQAEAAQREAQQYATRIRALYADSAATPAQLDAAEAGLARATAAVAQARGGNAELRAITEYAAIRAPFAGTVTRKFVDPGAFAAPGAPLVAIIDDSRLRVRVEVPLDVAQGIKAGQSLPVTIGTTAATAKVEGVVPAAGNLYVINALIANEDRRHLAGTPATLDVPQGTKRALLVPTAAIIRDGDLTGVDLATPKGIVRRWVRLGTTSGDHVEVRAGLAAGDKVVLPTAGAQ